MKQISIKLFCVLALFQWGCATVNNSSEKTTDYTLNKPDATNILPDILNEVSGLTEIDSVTIACIQDENGILFIYNILNNKIEKQYSFDIDGDYEGITRVHNTIYVLRSDGTLFEIKNYQLPDYEITSYTTGITAHNNEGLCYDAENNRLLIASKGKVAKGRQFKNKRVIYGFDLVTKTLSAEPVLEFDVQNIKQFVITHNINLPTKNNKKNKATEPIVKLMTSAIAIHPLTKNLYLLSAADYIFFVFNLNGNIVHIEPLDPEIFNKAEGITFLNNGDMLITNEAQKNKPTLLRFNYR
ncbi:MAG: hypothetical protein JNK61_01450 [Bacteroidia bacterium]|nr:hypothetical protein [Bacteroidia bacterium]